MIGDGMGLTQISSGMYANNNSTALEGFEYVGLSKTHALDKLVTCLLYTSPSPRDG